MMFLRRMAESDPTGLVQPVHELADESNELMVTASRGGILFSHLIGLDPSGCGLDVVGIGWEDETESVQLHGCGGNSSIMGI